LGHALVENRNGLIASAAMLMLAEKQKGRSRRIIVGANKDYYSEDFVRRCRS
jgi:hypothetical protein